MSKMDDYKSTIDYLKNLSEGLINMLGEVEMQKESDILYSHIDIAIQALKKNVLSDRIKCIADHYGYENQTIQTVSEMGELIQAITKLKLANGSDSKNEDRIRNFHEELADGSIMLEQMIYLFNCRPEVEIIKEEKIEKQLNIIKGEQLNARLKRE